MEEDQHHGQHSLSEHYSDNKRDLSSAQCSPFMMPTNHVTTNGNAESDSVYAESELAKTITKSRAAAQQGDRTMSRKKSPRATDGPESLAEMLRRGILDHQLGLSVNFILLVCLSWLLFPSLRKRLEAFAHLSYRTESGAFGLGPQDAQLVLSFIVLFTAARAFALEHLLTPLAEKLGIVKNKPKVRFAEQGFLLLYYCIYWSWGAYLLTSNTSALLPGNALSVNAFLVSLWTGYPKLYMDAGMKLYYLSQLAFWIQQIGVIHVEERRKDHYQMLTHHCVTVALISTSYGFRQCRVGTAVLVCMDLVDLVFPLAKMLRYLGWQAACDAAFALFVITWFVARHVAYLTLCWSVYRDFGGDAMPYGTYSLRRPTNDKFAGGLRLSPDGGREIFVNIFQPFVNPNAETVSSNAYIKWTFLGLLLGLQVITLMWFVLICKVVARVLRGEAADDSRSDDEGDEEEDVEDQSGPVQPCAPFMPHGTQRFIEVESTAEELSYDHIRRHGSGSGAKRRGKGISSSLYLGDRKDILNRIGCLSDEQLAREREKREGSEGPPKMASSGSW